MIAEITPITLNVPNYVWWIFSAGVIATIFFSGYQWHKLKEACNELPKMRRALDVISELLFSKGWTKEPVYVSAQSPLKLTPEGKQMLKDSGFDEFFNANKERFFAFINAEKPKSEAEVEKAARDLMLYLDTKHTPKIELVENFSYKIGQPVAAIIFAYSIEIKERYLTQYPIEPSKQ